MIKWIKASAVLVFKRVVRSVSLTQESRMGHGVAEVQGEKVWNATTYLSVKMQDLSWKTSNLISAPSHSNIPGLGVGARS